MNRGGNNLNRKNLQLEMETLGRRSGMGRVEFWGFGFSQLMFFSIASSYLPFPTTKIMQLLWLKFNSFLDKKIKI